MDQMNISISDHPAGYVRTKVESGEYGDADEVVRDALLRMEEDDLLVDEFDDELVREDVLVGLAELDRGEYTEYVGDGGLAQLGAEIKAEGRRLLKTPA